MELPFLFVAFGISLTFSFIQIKSKLHPPFDHSRQTPLTPHCVKAAAREHWHLLHSTIDYWFDSIRWDEPWASNLRVLRPKWESWLSLAQTLAADQDDTVLLARVDILQFDEEQAMMRMKNFLRCTHWQNENIVQRVGQALAWQTLGRWRTQKRDYPVGQR